MSGDPVATQSRMVAAAFRQKGLGDVADMIDYLADRADEQWKTLTDSLNRNEAARYLTLIEKGMGLPKGAKQVVLAEVEIVSNRTEPLGDLYSSELAYEGFPDMDALDFAAMWCKSHGYHFTGDWPGITVRRIEWRYL